MVSGAGVLCTLKGYVSIIDYSVDGQSRVMRDHGRHKLETNLSEGRKIRVAGPGRCNAPNYDPSPKDWGVVTRHTWIPGAVPGSRSAATVFVSSLYVSESSVRRVDAGPVACPDRIEASIPNRLANCSCCTAETRQINAAVLESEALNTAPVSVTLFDDGWLECRVLCQQLLDGVSNCFVLVRGGNSGWDLSGLGMGVLVSRQFFPNTDGPPGHVHGWSGQTPGPPACPCVFVLGV